MTKSSRKRRQRLGRDLAEKHAAMRKDFEELKRAGVKVGMSWDETIQLVCDGAGEMRRMMSREGLTTKRPWGVTCDPRSLEATLSEGFKMLLNALKELDSWGPEELPADPARFYATYVNGALTLAAAALLFLQSSPISYELSRHMIAIPRPAEPLEDRGRN